MSIQTKFHDERSLKSIGTYWGTDTLATPSNAVASSWWKDPVDRRRAKWRQPSQTFFTIPPPPPSPTSVFSSRRVLYFLTGARFFSKVRNLFSFLLLLLLLLLLSGQCPNPGPKAYPCGVCSRNVGKSGPILCTLCTKWVHPRCSGLPVGRGVGWSINLDLPAGSFQHAPAVNGS